jgi:hypothetical protein
MDGAGLVLADAHVHIYDCFEPKVFFDAAHANFRAQAERLGKPEGFVGLLLLSEASGCDWFHGLGGDRRRARPGAAVPGWTFEPTEESCSLFARSSDGRELLLIAGHQIVTAERLEVLALCSEERPREGLPLAESLECTTDLGGIPVVPWGAGKWLGPRGSLLLRLLEGRPHGGFFLGDNAGRLGLWRRPRHFRTAEQQGIRILPGSDPLPFPGHVSRAGSFGFSAAAPMGVTRPSRDLKRLFTDPSFVPRPYGSLAGPRGFVLDQLAMQVRNRTRGRRDACLA